MDQADNQSVIPMRYFLRIPNFGDLLNPLIVKALSGRESCWVGRDDIPHLMAIGSLMAGASVNSHVWGTGVMHPDIGLGSAHARNIHALRGPHSLMALRKSGTTLGDVPLGDPAILAPRLLGMSASSDPRHAVGVVAHYVDRQKPAIRCILAQDGVADLNVHDDPLSLIRTMAECKVVVSSSLHGLILAEALGLPSLWIKAGQDIIGDDFKFSDWFATTSNPQIVPYNLSERERIEALIPMAELRDHTIDMDALAAAFPIVGEWEGQSLVPRKSVAACRTAAVPVFLISFNRGPMLRKIIAGLQALSVPVSIIVHDNGSFDDKTLEILRDLEEGGVVVYRYGLIQNADELDRVNDSVARYFENWNEPCPYVVSDCDVDIAVAEADVLQVYAGLLNRFRKAECVGPMLRIRDIPKTYPLRNRALNRHIEQFWKNEPILDEQDGRSFAYQEAPIDTTFAMHRAGESFRRMKSGVRIYEPFEALHLDWYPQIVEGDEDEVYSATSHPDISHWKNQNENEKYAGCNLEFHHYRYVVLDGNRKLRVKTGWLDDV
ncbi:hypothetical protein EOE18_16820 [Novosphingobium umbonatum]|uniref:Polysaccharide pyruvyl transferase domain-containing protein n=1 Tax=Novosphingobium umbonatum TaxID=1908524 RepID=A0A3S2Y6G2_9SPHN|nr:polysaccharide pyruvyl transferase family protein [Novosphingobium umbonatum]RVU03275.1 hypothetical protein EOE18_16820 [Novosphingobium umbonatum]